MTHLLNLQVDGMLLCFIYFYLFTVKNMSFLASLLCKFYISLHVWKRFELQLWQFFLCSYNLNFVSFVFIFMWFLMLIWSVEFNQALQNDSARVQQLQCHTALSGHPFNRFFWGILSYNQTVILFYFFPHLFHCRSKVSSYCFLCRQ